MEFFQLWSTFSAFPQKSSSEQTEQYRQQVEELESQLHGVNENVERLEKELQGMRFISDIS